MVIKWGLRSNISESKRPRRQQKLASLPTTIMILLLLFIHKEIQIHGFNMATMIPRKTPGINSLHWSLKNCDNHDYDNHDYESDDDRLREKEVLRGLDLLYPPKKLRIRTSTSRKDGYWSYLENGLEPPKYLTYGEFDFLFFAQLLEKAFDYNNSFCLNDDGGDEKWRNKTFIDIGSGTGRLVIGAAALYPELKLSKGVEILPNLHASAMEFLEECNVCEGASMDDNITKEMELEDDRDNREEVFGGDGDYNNGDDYAQPLSNEMNKMINALQGMTAEEWKEILGDDFELDVELVEDDEDESEINIENVETSDNVNNERGLCDELDLDQITADVIDNNDGIRDDDDDIIDEVEKIRSQAEEIVPTFVLPSENELFKNTIDGENNIEEIDKDCSIYFTSFDDFLKMPEKELVNLLEEKRFIDGEKSSSNVIINNNDVNPDSNDDEKYQDKESVYYLKCPTHSGSIDGTGENDLLLSPIKFSCGSFEDPYEYVGDADVVFAFSTCWTQDMMKSLAQCIGRQCKPGTIAITTEFPMPLSGVVEAVEDDPEVPFGEYEMELVEKLDGYCGVTGGVSTAYIHRVVRSLYEEEGSGPRQKPKTRKEEMAWRIVQDYESKQLTDTEKFVRNAKNSLAFYSLDYGV